MTLKEARQIFLDNYDDVGMAMSVRFVTEWLLSRSFVQLIFFRRRSKIATFVVGVRKCHRVGAVVGFHHDVRVEYGTIVNTLYDEGGNLAAPSEKYQLDK